MLDFANNATDRKSFSGFVLKFNNNVTLWKTKKQRTVSLSSAEAEYVALSQCVCECIFIGQLLNEILDYNLYPIKVFEDNQSCIKMSTTIETKRTKHIDVKHHFIRNHVSKNEIMLVYIPTSNQIADMLTNALPVSVFTKFRDMLNIKEI